MTWQERAIELYYVKGKGPAETRNIINSEYNIDIDYEKLRNYLRRRHSITPTVKDEFSQEKLLEALNKGYSINTLCEQLNITERLLTAHIDDLKENGYQIEDINGKVKLINYIIPKVNEYEETWSGEKIIRFGVTSDNHLCNKMQQLSFLHYLYDIFEKEGIKKVYNVGDLFDGYYKKRPDHIFELIPGCIGTDEQVEYAKNNYPYRKGIITEEIGGNHCATHIINGGANPWKSLIKEREDIKYLGMYNAVINITPNCKIELNHPGDGSAYALSYSIQKYIDSMMGGEKPSILLNGHHHKLMYLFYRNIHAFETGCTEAQTGFMKGKKLAAHVGGLIIEVHVDKDGTITRCKNEIIPCYTMLKDDWGKY